MNRRCLLQFLAKGSLVYEKMRRSRQTKVTIYGGVTGFTVLSRNLCFCLSVQYAIYMYGYLKEWRENKQMSFSCCLAFLLPLNDLQGEISGMVGNNMLANQLQTGQIEMPTIQAAVKDSGVVDVNLDDDQEEDHNQVEVQDDNRRDAQEKNTESHQGTQTELKALFSVVHVPVKVKTEST